MGTYQEYIVGTSPVPKWVRGRILPYKKMNGETGYEYKFIKNCVFKVAELEAGDSLIRYGGEIYIQRKDYEYERHD